MARTAVAKAEDDLSILQHELDGIVNQFDAHHREEDAGEEVRSWRWWGHGEDMEGGGSWNSG